MLRHLLRVTIAILLSGMTARATLEWGGCDLPGRTTHWRLTDGAVVEFEGMVEETTRKLYDVTGSTWKQADAETFETDDFNLDGPFGTIGLAYERNWAFVTFQWDLSLMNPSASAVARRNYYIGVSEIEFGGESYDQMKIPAGTPFSADIMAGLTELTWLFTPVGINIADTVRVTPSLDLGLLLFAGQYDIDAGAPQGVTTYQNPPEYFVVGGEASGMIGLGIPQAGAGLELRFGSSDAFNWMIQGHYMVFQYDGSTGFFTTADHRDKNIDADHRNFKFRTQAEFRLASGRCITLGAEAQVIETEGAITSTATDPDDILALQERFDKNFALRIGSAAATLGVTF